ncbi:hypothetical protein ACLI08_02590 [Flavobacterium sp. RNTU_13]|uniref:hypothetical protein n=1 Tax=Flavobacterium sp. RNTU_13 TaxID=3375145 RepID=UPI003987CE14
MEVTTNEIAKIFRERLRYPIITVYGIILIIYNWDVLAIFFLSTKPIEARIDFINTTYAGQTIGRILWPLVKAILISIIAPGVMLGLDFILKFINRWRQDIRDEKALQTWEKKKEIAIHEFEYDQAKSGSKTIQEWEAKVSELNNNIVGLHKQFDNERSSLTSSIESYNSTITSLNNELVTTTDNLEILRNEVRGVKNDNHKLRTIIDHFIKRIENLTGLTSQQFETLIFAVNDTSIIDILGKLQLEGIHFNLDYFYKTVIEVLVRENVVKYEDENGIKLTDLGEEILNYYLPF